MNFPVIEAIKNIPNQLSFSYNCLNPLGEDYETAKMACIVGNIVKVVGIAGFYCEVSQAFSERFISTVSKFSIGGRGQVKSSK